MISERRLKSNQYIPDISLVMVSWQRATGDTSWVEQKRSLIKNNGLYCAVKEAQGSSRGTSEQNNSISHQRPQTHKESRRDQNRSGQLLCVASSQQQRCDHKRNHKTAPAPTLSPSHFHFLWLARCRIHSTPNPPTPVKVEPACSGEGGKCWLTSQRQACLSAGHVQRTGCVSQ